MKKIYKFIIDTTQYAGNFEREMSGWLTGVDDEYACASKLCRKMKEIAPQEVLDWFGWTTRKHTDYDHWPKSDVFIFDDHDGDNPGYDRINSLEWTPGTEGKYNSVAIYFSEKPPDYVIEFMKKQAHDFVYDGVLHRSLTKHTDIVTGFRLIETETNETETEIEV